MNIEELTREIINGRRLKEDEDLSFFKDCDLTKLCKAADKLRTHFNKNKIDLCTIVNAKSGKCGENCKYCAQSVHYHTNCNEYPFMNEKDILANAKANYLAGVDRFSIVTSGRALSREDLGKCISAIKLIKKECPKLKICASLGLLSLEDYKALKEAGLSRVHNNIETAPSFFPKICTSHKIEDKLMAIKNARDAGLDVCSGGIIGLGESFDDRIEMALFLSKLKIKSIPINVLIAIKGTPLENNESLKEDEILRTIATFKFINPEADIRLAGGRILLKESGKKAFLAGASASITGNMLTTSGYTINSDRQMLTKLGRSVIAS